MVYDVKYPGLCMELAEDSGLAATKHAVTGNRDS